MADCDWSDCAADGDPRLAAFLYCAYGWGVGGLAVFAAGCADEGVVGAKGYEDCGVTMLLLGLDLDVILAHSVHLFEVISSNRQSHPLASIT